MKKHLLAKVFSFALASVVASSACLLPRQNVLANDDIEGSGECIFSLEEDSEHMEGRLLVSTDGTDLASISSIEDAVYSIKNLNLSCNENLYAVECDPSLSSEEIEDLFSGIAGINYVQYDYLYTTDVLGDVEEITDSSVDDEYIGYHLDYVHAPDAWPILEANGYQKVRVGIIDMGVDFTHPDLEGQVNLALSYDATCEEPLTEECIGDHGTHVAGIVAAYNDGTEEDISRGIASGSRNDVAELVSINVDDEEGYIFTSYIVTALCYATDIQCRVVNMSIGGYGYDLAMEQGCSYAYDRGVILCCSAGNANKTEFHHPSDYPECIATIATGAFEDPTANVKADYSCYGLDKDLSAPGTHIASTYPGGKYVYMSGTSMATPVVTGVVTLILAANPNLTSTDVKNIMEWTAQDLYTPGFDIYTGYGLVNAASAVQLAYTLTPGFGKTPRQDFIWRLYDIILDRYPDDTGYAHWQEEFDKGATGSDVVRCFCLSQELQNKNLTDDQFISILYRAIFNRAPDDVGFEQWQLFLECGGSREGLVAHFINSQEFANLCAVYGIPTGAVLFPSAKDMNPNTLIFVYRAYKICFRREAEAAGLDFWCEKMNSGEISAGDFISQVFQSQEYRNFNKLTINYIYDLYNAFFGREPDDDGFDHWYDMLESKRVPRDSVLNDFIHSQEFINLCEAYGVRPF